MASALGEGRGESVDRRGVSAALYALYRLVWVALFAVALVSVGYANARFEWYSQRFLKAGMALGLLAYQNNAAEGMLLAPFGFEGRQIGFRDNDLLLTVDGRPVGPNNDTRYPVLAGQAGSVATLMVRHPDGSFQQMRVARDPERLRRAYAGWGINFSVRRWIAFAVREVAGIASMLAALLLFLRRPGDKVAQLLSFALVLGQASIANVFARAPAIMADAQVALIFVVLTLAVLLFPQGRLRDGWQRLALASSIVGNVVNLTFYLYSWYPDWALLPFGVPFTFLLYAVLRQLRRTPPGVARQQTKSVLFGVAAFCVLELLNGVFVEAQSYTSSAGADAWVVLFAHLTEALAGVAIPAGLLVSLLRFRLYDAETAISRSVAYGALTVILLAIFAGSEKVIEVFGEHYLGAGLGTLSGALGAAIAAGTMVPLHHRVTRWAERRFQGDLVHLRKGLPALVADLRETASPQALADATLVRIEKGVRASHGAVIAAGEIAAARDIDVAEVQGWLSRTAEPLYGLDRLHTDRSDMLFPMRVPLHADGVGLAGWLVLGPRPDGSFYGKDEREALLEVADPVARALAIASERHGREAGRESVLNDLRQRLAELELVVLRLIKGTVIEEPAM